MLSIDSLSFFNFFKGQIWIVNTVDFGDIKQIIIGFFSIILGDETNGCIFKEEQEKHTRDDNWEAIESQQYDLEVRQYIKPQYIEESTNTEDSREHYFMGLSFFLFH